MGSREDPYEKWRCPRKAALAKAGRGRPGAEERTPRERGDSAGGRGRARGKEGGRGKRGMAGRRAVRPSIILPPLHAIATEEGCLAVWNRRRSVGAEQDQLKRGSREPGALLTHSLLAPPSPFQVAHCS